MKKPNILVILPIARDRIALSTEKITQQFNIHYLDDAHFAYDAPCEQFKVHAYVLRAIAYVEAEQIDAIVYTHDMASLIAALVCRETGLTGPSIDSVFQAAHKYYSRQIDMSNIRSKCFHIDDDSLDNTYIEYPCYVKAPSLMCSHLQFIVHNEAEMRKTIGIMKNELNRWSRVFFDFFKLYIPQDEYPLAHEPVMVIEELMQDYQQCAIEGWVDSYGKIHIWAISDINYHEMRMQTQNCYSMPTRTSADVQQEMITSTTQAIMNLGLTSGFFNVDLWHWNGQRPCKVIEINGRAASLYYLMHQQLFGSDLYSALIYCALKDDQNCYLESPHAKVRTDEPPIFGALFFVVTQQKGSLGQIIDADAVVQMQQSPNIKGVEYLAPLDYDIRDNGTAGFRCMKFFVFGASYATINQIADHWRSRILRESSSHAIENLESPLAAAL